MGVSEIIMLLTLVIAIVAILNEKNRGHILLKFNEFDYVVLCLSFVLINYFVFYNSFYSRGIYFSSLYFHDFGFKNPKNWAYLITLITVLYIFFKIWYSFYPYSKIDKVISYYRKQIENGEISFLLDLIERYHCLDIIRGIEQTPNYNSGRVRVWFNDRRRSLLEKWQEFREKIIRDLFPQSWQNKQTYATQILNHIINSPHFMELAANIRPYLFARIFGHFRKLKRGGFPDDLVNPFFAELLKGKNFWLKKELRESMKNDPTQPDWFYEQNKILGSLLLDLSVADVNEVWRPFGEAAIAEIEEERTREYEGKMFNEYTEEELLWSFKTYWVIQFFTLLVNQAITDHYTESHFWLFYYDRMVDSILETFEKYPPPDFETLTSIYHKFIFLIIQRTFYWLEQANKKSHPGIYHDILTCLGQSIYSACKSPYFGNERKISILDDLFRNYCRIEENKHSNDLRSKYEKIILRPVEHIREEDPYYVYLAEAWKKFDKLPHRSMHGRGYDLPYFARLKREVIRPLRLNPNEY